MMKKNILACLCLGLAFACGGCTLHQTSTPHVVGLVQSINEDELQGYSKALASIGSRPDNNEPKTDLTVRFIESALKDAGYQLSSTRPVDLEEGPWNYNIIAEIKGTCRPECIVELGAHYDTVPFCPGANDNGSGVSGALAVARALATTRCSKTIRFVFYCCEETNGTGSLTHVRNILENEEESFEGAIVFDMIGYAVEEPDTQRTPLRIPFLLWPPRTGNFITVVGNTKSTFIGKRYERSVRKYVPDFNFYSVKRLGGFLKDAARSDHASYWRSKLPALMLTDTGNFRNPNYHQPSDRIETLNFDFMTKVTRAAAATLLEWAEAEPMGVEELINNKNTEPSLTFYRKPCKRVIHSRVIDNPAIGLSIKGLSREEACRRVATNYWNAVINGDEELVSKLWCAFPSGEYPPIPKENRPQKIVDIRKPYLDKGCYFGTPTLITPTRIQLTNGRIVDKKLIIILRDLDMEETGLIVGTWGG